MSELMNGREVAIKLSGVKKMYKLGQIGGGSLQADLQSWWARVRGKEDPNIKIGEERLTGQTFMALNGVDMTVYKGEALGIIGGNGAGKSTMLKLLSRVTAPTEGEIDIYGRVASMLEVGTGFNGEMTGRENVYLNGAILGMTKEEIDAKMEDIIEFSEVRDFIDTPVKRYSSGMYVKLAFSVAAHLDSEIMIMDEVLAVGDMAFQKKCLDKMRDAAKKEGRTVLYVSHNMNTIRQLCDRCVVLDKGRVVFEGDVEKAIVVYMGGATESRLVNDCRNIARERYGDGGIHINALEILDKDDPVLYDNDELKIRLTFTAEKAYANIAFRCVIFSATGVPVGMAASRPNANVEIGENQLTYSMQVPQISEGSYSGRIVLYEVDDFGNEEIHDVVNSAFVINKQFKNNVNETATQWKQQVWGNIVFPTIELVK